jgi:hypothetical protein
MKRHVFVTAVLIIALTLLIFSPAQAQDDSLLINYQGMLTDETGEPLTGTYQLTFTIYDAASDGTVQWTETYPEVSVNNGLFNVLLGSVVPLENSVFTGEDRWLGITVGVGGDPEISPRSLLTTVPSAAYAKQMSGGDVETGEGYLTLKAPDGETAVSISTIGRGSPAFLRMYNPDPLHPYQSLIEMSSEESGGKFSLLPPGDVPANPAFTVGLEPTPFNPGYMAFYDPSGDLPHDPYVKMGFDPTPFRGYLEFYDPGSGWFDSPVVKMGVEPSPFHWGYIAMYNPEIGPPPKLMEMGINDSTGEWASSFSMYDYSAHPPDPCKVFEISNSPSTGASLKMATPLPEPPANLLELKVEEIAGPVVSWASFFNMYSMDPGDDGRETFEIANTLADGISLKMFNPQPEPPAIYFEVNANPSSGPSLGFFDDIGQVMGLDPSPFNEAFSMYLMDPVDKKDMLVLSGNHITDETSIRLMDPVDEKNLLAISGIPSSGASLRMFNPQPEPPALLLDIGSSYGTKGGSAEVSLYSDTDALESHLTPGRLSLNSSPGPTIGQAILLEIDGSEAKVGIGTDSPSEPLVVGDDLTFFSGNLITVGDANPISYAGISFGQDADNRGWMIYDNEDDYIYFGTKEDGEFSPDAIFIKGGDLGIGTSTPGADLHVVGDICYTGSIGTCSDIRYKKNIRTLDNALDKVARLRGVAFNWKRDTYPEYQFSGDEQVGLIAQELKEVFPQAVSKDNNGYYNVDYGKLTPLLVEAVKELKAQNEELRQEIELLKSRF